MIGNDGIGGEEGYKYGALDYVGDIWDIKEKSSTFDTILCTEVFEHIPHPIETLKEFRLRTHSLGIQNRTVAAMQMLEKKV